MNVSEKERINRTTGLRILWLRINFCFRNLKSNRISRVLLLILIIVTMLAWGYSDKISMIICGILKPAIPFCTMLFRTVLLLLFLRGLIILATPLKAAVHNRGFKKIGLVNHTQEAPVLLLATVCDNYILYEYEVQGIPLSSFMEKKENIEAALNLSIISFLQGENKHRILVKAVDGAKQLPMMIRWNDNYIQNDDSKIVLGRDLTGFRIVDLDVSPHIQCGGSTGSGKTILLKCVLHQLKQNGVKIYLCDFKGFIDFPLAESTGYECIRTKQELNCVLQNLIEIMNERKKLFRDAACKNITEYNQKESNSCQRIILASDEVAYAFQKKGLRGEDKEIVEQIEANMGLIAQQGRFAGIHLWLSTQRGDADTIPPQIRSNMTTRICGRGSDILSRVTVDNSLASEIPVEYKGRFVDDNEEFFQAFYFKEQR